MGRDVVREMAERGHSLQRKWLGSVVRICLWEEGCLLDLCLTDFFCLGFSFAHVQSFCQVFLSLFSGASVSIMTG